LKPPATVDTRFFLTHFMSKEDQSREKTRRKIGELEREKAIVPTMVIHEVYKLQYEALGAEVAGLRVDSILKSSFRFVELTVPIAITAARLRCLHRGLPTADSIIAATALEWKSNRILSDDPHFAQIDKITTEWI
jgi:predicted nucleic acid-binding protein